MVDRDARSSLVWVLEAQAHLKRAKAELSNEHDDAAVLLDGLLAETDAVRDVLEAGKHDSSRWGVEPEAATRDFSDDEPPSDAK